MINPEQQIDEKNFSNSNQKENGSGSGFADALKIIEQKYGIKSSELTGQTEKIGFSIGQEVRQLIEQNFKFPAAVLMGKIAELSRSLQPMELQLASQTVGSIQRGESVGDFDSLVMQILGSGNDRQSRGGFDRRAAKIRAELVVALILCTLWLASCLPGLPVIMPPVVNDSGLNSSEMTAAAGTETAASQTIPATETAEPTDVPATPTETLPPTEMPLPDYLVDLVGRFGEAVSGKEVHMVLKEKQPVYIDVEYKGLIIRSIIPVEYAVNGKKVKKIMLGTVCKKMADGQYQVYNPYNFEPSTVPSCPTVEALKKIDPQVAKLTKGDTPVIKVSADWNVKGIFDDIFPEEPSDVLQTINIEGVGEVLIGQHIEFIDGLNN